MLQLIGSSDRNKLPCSFHPHIGCWRSRCCCQMVEAGCRGCRLSPSPKPSAVPTSPACGRRGCRGQGWKMDHFPSTLHPRPCIGCLFLSLHWPWLRNRVVSGRPAAFWSPPCTGLSTLGPATFVPCKPDPAFAPLDRRRRSRGTRRTRGTRHPAEGWLEAELEQHGGLGEGRAAIQAHWVEKAETTCYLSVLNISLFSVFLVWNMLFLLCCFVIRIFAQSRAQKQHRHVWCIGFFLSKIYISCNIIRYFFTDPYLLVFWNLQTFPLLFSILHLPKLLADQSSPPSNILHLMSIFSFFLLLCVKGSHFQPKALNSKHLYMKFPNCPNHRPPLLPQYGIHIDSHICWILAHTVSKDVAESLDWFSSMRISSLRQLLQLPQLPQPLLPWCG